MIKRLYVNDAILHLVLLLLCLGPILISFMLTTNGNAASFRISIPWYLNIMNLPCVFKEVTGYNCPACGMTRCFVYMSRLDIGAAWWMNKAGVLLWFFCVFQIVYRFLLLLGANVLWKKYLQAFQTIYAIVLGLLLSKEFIGQFLV